MRDERLLNKLNTEVSAYRSVLRKGIHQFHTPEEWKAWKSEGVEGYVKHISDLKSAGNAKSLGLGYNELAKLYSINLSGFVSYLEVLTGSPLFSFVSYDTKTNTLKLNEGKLSRWIEEETTVKFTKRQQKVIDHIAEIQAVVTEARKVSPNFLHLLQANSRTGEVKPLVAQIKASV